MSAFGGITAEEASINLKIAFGGCPHLRAEPVILSTGEQVACVCASCLRQLPREWISNQRDRAHREAFCKHEEWLEMPELGRLAVDAQCRACSTWR